MIALAKQKGRLRVTAKETGSPTYTLDLSLAVAWVIEEGLTGLYHVTNAGWCSRYEFATEIVKLGGFHDVPVEPAEPGEIPVKAARPTFGVLSNDRWESSGGPPLRHWKDALRAYLFSRQDRWTLLQAGRAATHT